MPKNTQLHDAVRNNDAKSVEALLKNGAKTHLADKDFKIPVQYIDSKNTNIPLLVNLLRHRTFFGANELAKWMAFCRAHYIGDEKNAQSSANDVALLDYVVSCITGTNISLLRNKENCIRYGALLESIKGKLHQPKDGKIVATDLEGWSQPDFLAFRIRIFLEIALRIELGLIKPLVEFNKSQIQRFFHEISVELECLQVSLNMAAIKISDQSPDHPELTQALAENIVEQLKKLVDGQEYSFSGGWIRHSMYISCIRQKEDLLIRVDNLGPGCDDNHLANQAYELKDHYFYPRVLGKISFKQLSNFTPSLAALIQAKTNLGCKVSLQKEANLQAKIKVTKDEKIINEHKKEIENLRKQRWDTLKSEALKATYISLLRVLKQATLTESAFYPAELIQTTGRCVAASHNIGLRIRLGNETFYEWILTQERQVLARLQNQPVQENVNDYGLLLNQPLGLPQRLDIPLKKHYQAHAIIRFLFSQREVPLVKNYINLSILEEKELKQLESASQDNKHDSKNTLSASINNAENLYSHGKLIDIETIFQYGNNNKQQILILGRAGVGKTTFCKHVLQHWMTGKLWSNLNFSYIFHISLRNLNAERYRPGKQYSLTDIIYQECFSASDQAFWTPSLYRDVDHLLQANEHKILWLLDGYDELVQPLPAQLQSAWEDLKNQCYCITTSRPNAAPTKQLFSTRLEITGFSNENISHYIKQFFTASVVDESEKLLKFLHANPNIFSIAHVSINLELICSLLSEQAANLKNTQNLLTITNLYQQIILWLLRRFLKNQGMKDELLISDERILDRSASLLEALECIAFLMMRNKRYQITQQELMQITGNKKSCADDLLNLHVLMPTLDAKQNNAGGYFAHLTFQEYFAACYLVRGLQNEESLRGKNALKFIQEQKYQRHLMQVFSFTAGLLSAPHNTKPQENFWKYLQASPRDLVGVYHQQLVIQCLNESKITTHSAEQKKCIEQFKSWCFSGYCSDSNQLYKTLFRAPHVISQLGFLKHLRTKFNNDDDLVRCIIIRKWGMYGGITAMPEIIEGLIAGLTDPDPRIRSCAASAVGQLNPADIPPELLDALANLFDDQDRQIKLNALCALDRFGAIAARPKILNGLVNLLHDEEAIIRQIAALQLGRIEEATAYPNVLNNLSKAQHDKDDDVRSNAIQALSQLLSTIVRPKVLAKIIADVKDNKGEINLDVAILLGSYSKSITKSAFLPKVLTLLADMLQSNKKEVKDKAVFIVSQFGSAAVTPEILRGLLNIMFEDKDRKNIIKTIFALSRLGSKAATPEVLEALINAFNNGNIEVEITAIRACGDLGPTAATPAVLNALVFATSVQHKVNFALEALGIFGVEALTPHVVIAIVKTLGNKNIYVRRRAAETLSKLKLTTDSLTIEIREIIFNILLDKGDENKYERDDIKIFLAKALISTGQIDITRRVLKILEKMLSPYPGKILGFYEDVRLILGLFSITAISSCLQDSKVDYSKALAVGCLQQNVTITFSDQQLEIYDDEGVVQIPINAAMQPSLSKFIDALAAQATEQGLPNDFYQQYMALNSNASTHKRGHTNIPQTSAAGLEDRSKKRTRITTQHAEVKTLFNTTALNNSTASATFSTTQKNKI